MALLTLLKLLGKSFHVLTWPLITLGYPLYASIRAIESNSNADNRKLLTYWVLYALIMLFELTFAKLIEWLPYWPYMKLIATCWLVIPYFDAAIYVYEHFVRPCLYVNPHTFCNWFNKQKEECLLRSSCVFLLVAERYIKEYGSEELEKLISSKANCLEPSNFRTGNNAVAATKNIEVAAVEGVNCTKPNLAQTENKAVTAMENKATASAGRGCEVSRSLDTKKAEKEWTCAPCQVITPSEAVLKDPLQGKKHNLAQTENKTVAAMENKAMAAMASSGRGCEVSRSLDMKKAEKERTCAPCQVITPSEAVLKDPLQGKQQNLALTENKTVSAMENKAMAAMASSGRGCEVSRSLDTKKAEKERTCAPCQVITPSEAVLKDPLQGKQQNLALTENKTVAAMENKAMAAMASSGRGCEVSRSLDPKKAEKEWTCAPCQVITPSEAVLKDSLQGKKQNLTLTENKTVAAMENKAMAAMTSSGRGCEVSISLDPKKAEKEWTCAPCQLITPSEAVLKDPLQGKKQNLALTENKTVAAMGNKATAATASSGRGSELSGSLDPKKAQNEWTCAPSQLITPSEAVLKDHLQGKKHNLALTENKTIATTENKATAAMVSAVRDSELSGPHDPKKAQNEWTCALCQVITPSEAVLKDHLQGEKHKFKEEEVRAKKMATKKNVASVSNPKNVDQPTVSINVKKQEEKVGVKVWRIKV